MKLEKKNQFDLEKISGSSISIFQTGKLEKSSSDKKGVRVFARKSRV